MKTYSEDALGGKVGTRHERGLDGLRKAMRNSLELSDFIADTVRAMVRRHRARRALRAQRRMLAELDERTLKDIGLHRSEIDSLVAEIESDQPPTRRRAHKDSVAPLY